MRMTVICCVYPGLVSRKQGILDVDWLIVDSDGTQRLVKTNIINGKQGYWGRRDTRAYISQCPSREAIDDMVKCWREINEAIHK